MISRTKTGNNQPTLFFITTTFKAWQPLMVEAKTRSDFEDLLFSVSGRKADALMGYVIMPEHIHLLAGFRMGEAQMSKFIQTLKSLSARWLFPGNGSVWMERYAYLPIASEEYFRSRLNYIHQNPVRKGLVLEAIDWTWSSARFWGSEEKHEVLTKSWEWLEADEDVHLKLTGRV